MLLSSPESHPLSYAVTALLFLYPRLLSACERDMKAAAAAIKKR